MTAAYMTSGKVTHDNTLLSEFRSVFASAGDLYTVPGLAAVWADLIAHGYDWAEEDLEGITPEEEAHALRVFRRLVALQ
jgi:hypothetical protein